MLFRLVLSLALAATYACSGEMSLVDPIDGGPTPDALVPDGGEPPIDATTPVDPMTVTIDAAEAATMGERFALALVIENRPAGCAAEVRWSAPEAPTPVVWEDSGLAETAVTFFGDGDHTLAVEVSCADQSASDQHSVAVTGTPDEGTDSRFAEGPRELHATIHSIGIEWDLSGDSDHDAFGAIQVRQEGSDVWRGSLPLVRIDYAFDPDLSGADRPGEPRDWNMLAGSALFLEEGATYDVEIVVADPDGGFALHAAEVTMRAEPVVPSDAPRRFVRPGGGGGSGTESDPFRGIDAADAAASPGDVFVLLPGDYGHVDFDESGESGAPIIWTTAEGAEPVLQSADIGGDHVWLDGLHFERTTRSSAVRPSRRGVHHVVIRRCDFDGFHYTITTNEGAHDWTIIDNVIVGDNDPAESRFEGEGVELSHTSGHVVAYNDISFVADGVSYARRNCDIYGNDIWDTSDDGIEPDYGLANIRVWSNRIRDVYNNGLSFQPQRSGPWYFLFNQVVVDGLWVFKFNGMVDRSVMIHNTFVNRDDHIARRPSPLLGMWTRNNLFVSGGSRVLEGTAFDENTHLPNHEFYAVDWRTGLDYDGFAWASDPEVSPIRWLGTSYETVADWAAALGVEPNGVGLTLSDIGDLDRGVLTLPNGSGAIDRGAYLGPVHRHHAVAGAAPDLGAHEHGTEPTTYGRR